MRKGFLSGARTKMEIYEVMTSTVHTIYPEQTVETAAEMMATLKVGSLILEPKVEDQPLGIITERDIVTRVIASKQDPAKVTVNEIATRPVVTVPPTLEIAEAMALMAKLNIRRLVVVKENKVVGICTYRNLLRVAPKLLEIALEIEQIRKNYSMDDDNELITREDTDFAFDDEEEENIQLSLGFYCAQCGEWYEGPAYEQEDSIICKDCFEDNLE